MEQAAAQEEFVETPIVVRYAETDQMGVVYYANYFVWFEVGRNAWCRAKGFSYRDMESNHRRFMTVAEATCRYKAPARYEDDVAVRTRAEAPKDKVVRFWYEVVNRTTGQILATGCTTHIVTDDNMRPAAIPDHFRPLFGLPPR
jgi:acyl-CoA thioester hydrolase